MAKPADEDPRITGPDTAAVRTVADLARLLRQLRRRDARHRGDSQLTYRELAAKTGWSRSLIGLYLSGQALPPTDRFDVLVQLLGASPAEQGVLATIRDRVEEGRHTGLPAEGRPAGTEPGRRDERLVVPRALPAPTPHFIGRENERRMLTQLIKAHVDPGGRGADVRARDERGGGGRWNTVAVVVIGGTAGVGKTALAVHWAHQVSDHFPDGQLYVNLRGFDAAEQVMDPAEAVRCLLDALPVPPQRIPAGLDAQAALYRSLLAGRRMLIVLDNARDPGQVRPLLPGTPGCLVLVTSRSRLSGLVAADGAHPVLLDLLSPAEGRELLTRRLGAARVNAEPDAVDEIVDRCARLPLALAIVAARAATHPAFGLADLAGELRDTHRRWATLTNDDAATDVGSVFSWSYQALSPDAARLFRLLGLHPGPDITAPAAASLAGLTPPQVRPLLSALTQAHLLAEPTPGRYALHDLLRDYAAEQAVATDADEARHAASRRMLDHYVHTAYAADRLLSTLRDPIDIGRPEPGCEPETLADAGQALDWFHAEHHVLLAAVNHAAATGFDRVTWRLAWALTTYLDRGGLWFDWIATMRPAAAAARRIGEASAEALAHRLLARAYMRLHHLDGAYTHLQHALDLFARGGDQVGQAHTHLNLSDLWEQQGRQAEAVEEARRALDLYRAAGHRPGQADALNTVGWCLAQKGAYAEAIPYCEEALVLHRDLGPGIVQATTWDSLGFAHHHLGHHTEAIACYRAAVDMFRGLGARADEATTLTGLGDAHQAAGDIAAARDAWRRALAILDDLAHPDADDVHARLERVRP
jgi:tetratricopeptide (TPR) repeat protein